MAEALRICVTGLSRAGKTAFLTALVHALHAAPLAPQAYPAWSAARAKRLIRARILPPGGAVQSLEAFPYEAHLAALRDPAAPRWPEATQTPRALTVEVTLDRPPGWALRQMDRLLRREAAVRRETRRITLLDYPGEWAMDLPLLEQGFAAWSAETLTAMAEPPRATLAGPFRAALAAIEPTAPYEDAAARRAHAAFLAYLEACRDQARLVRLQPGLFLRPEKAGGREAILAQEPFRFFPLAAAVRRAPRGSFAAVLGRRFDGYRRDHVRRFFESLRGPGTTRQVVLFDLLGALTAGPEAYADAKAALRQVAEAMRPRLGLLARLCGDPVRVLYAATKADLLLPEGRQRLGAHLARILGGLVTADGGRETGQALALAAIRATAEGADAWGRPAVVGCRLDPRTGRLERDQALRFPLPPDGPPTERDWTKLAAAHVIGFDLPNFLPDPDILQGRHDLPHIGLDAALAFLLDGHV